MHVHDMLKGEGDPRSTPNHGGTPSYVTGMPDTRDHRGSDTGQIGCGGEVRVAYSHTSGITRKGRQVRQNR